ncbi:MAG: VanW family protein [Patescibacteria group bacterium]|nr:VanW family protein [Patescibacteria group bacterium]
MKKGKNKINLSGKQRVFSFIKGSFWFVVGAVLGLFFCASFIFIIFQNTHKNVVYPGVMINGINFGHKTKEDVRSFFAEKNNRIADTKFVFTDGRENIVITAKQLGLGYDEDLLANQAYSIGRTKNLLSDIAIIFQAYVNGVNLSSSYHYSDNYLMNVLSPTIKKLTIAPTDALFTFQDGKVTAFRPSSNGQEVDIESLKSDLAAKIPGIISTEKPLTIVFPLIIKVVEPKVTTDKANNLGIKELVASGTSLFQHSIPERIHNVTLAATKLNGVLIAPNEVFSFNNAVGDISAATGYKQAYVIQSGKTVLGDGGGVCQVSTTLFRAALNAGLPITERHAHAYRVGYYEQDSAPGLDATVYAPSVDLKFKNDTGNSLLIQTSVDQDNLRLTFFLYGTKDNRQVLIEKPVVVSQSPALPPVYQDDPSLQKGIIKQIDFSANGMNTYFTRQVTKNGRIITSDKFVSNFRPWAAVYLKGTKE